MTHHSAEIEKAWTARLAPYRVASNSRAVIELLITSVLLIACWILSWAAYTHVGLLASLVVAIPGGALMVRMFTLQHDCGHGSMFKSQKVNTWVGRVLSLITMTPYDSWRDSHARHHANSGNLDLRGYGDIDTLTVDEYMKSSAVEKFKYRLYRHPFVLFGVGPAYMFFLRHRVPLAMNTEREIWVKTMITNVVLAVFFLVLILIVGLPAFLWVHFPMIVIGATLGMWMFYVQHQFDDTMWDVPPKWKRDIAALHGSSFYDLPKPFMWLTGNIGIHHVHHLSSKIPAHQLPKVLRDFPELQEAGRLTFKQSLKTIRLALWDEKERRLISFREARQLQMA